MLLSASVNSISSIPSPVYQCKKAFLLNIAVNCSLTRRNISWIDVEFPMNVAAIFRPVGGMSHTVDLTLFGIHSTNNARVGDQLHTSCSLHPTFAGLAQAQSRHEKYWELTAWSCKLEGSEADVIQGLVVENHALICILHELVDRQCGIVRFHDCVRNFGGWEDRESQHHPIRVLFPDL
nr:protein TUB21 [Ipomoea batatas]